MKATVNRIKHVSNHRRYEWMYRNGVRIGNKKLRGEELNDLIDEKIWREEHPGQDLHMEIIYGVPTQREEVGGESGGGDGAEAGSASPQG